VSFVSTARLWAVLALPLAAGCTYQQRLYTFDASLGPETLIYRVGRALAAEGFQPDTVAPDLGIIYTRWENQGLCFMPRGEHGWRMRRFIATLPSGSTVTVRAIVQCCAKFNVSPDGKTPYGPCVSSLPLPEADQRELDALGLALQNTLAL
jgi:hypothetical protein